MENQEQRLNALLDYLLAEGGQHTGFVIPETIQSKQDLLRGLMNVRPPRPISEDFLRLQDEYLRQEREMRGVVSVAQAEATKEPGLNLWQGDITRLAADAIVNAANSALLGCFIPCHNCIDNAIHSAAGVQLRLACDELIRRQGAPEKTGGAKITPGFNLPATYVLHTVGPVISGPLTQKDCELLAACYTSCLALAEQHGLSSIAFCCISTGEFRFPGDKAAAIAVQTVKDFQQHNKQAPEKVIFNVFKDSDYQLYKRILG